MRSDIQNVKFSMPYPTCKIQDSIYKTQYAECDIQNAKCSMQNPISQIKFAETRIKPTHAHNGDTKCNT